MSVVVTKPESSSDFWTGILLHLSLDTLRSAGLGRCCAGEDRGRPDHPCGTLASSGKTINAINILIAPLWLYRVEVSVPTRTAWEDLWLLQHGPFLALNPLWVVARPAGNVVDKTIWAELLSQPAVSASLPEFVALHGVFYSVFA